MRPKGSAEVLEDRRHRALALLKRRLSLNEVARKLGCAASSVMRWRNRFQRGGVAALKVRPTPGRPPKLTARQLQGLVSVLSKGAMARGRHQGQLWGPVPSRPCRAVDAQPGVEPPEARGPRIAA